MFKKQFISRERATVKTVSSREDIYQQAETRFISPTRPVDHASANISYTNLLYQGWLGGIFLNFFDVGPFGLRSLGLPILKLLP